MLKQKAGEVRKDSSQWPPFLLGMIAPLIWVLPQIVISRMGDIDLNVAIFIFDWSRGLAILIGIGLPLLRAYQLRKGGWAHESSLWLTGLMTGIFLAVTVFCVSLLLTMDIQWVASRAPRVGR